MNATCPHVGQLGDVPDGLDYCEVCVEQGGTWVHLRQCLVCGLTACCDSSPNQHASRHARAVQHPVMRSLEEGEDWSWCFGCEKTLRRRADGSWSEVDTFFETGLWYAQQRADASGSAEPEPQETTADGFPLGVWATTYRERRRTGELDPEQATALEELPGWRW